MKKTLVFMRTHYFNSAVFSEYKKLSSSLDESYECVLFIDNHTNFLNIEHNEIKTTLSINDENIKAFIYDKSVHDSLKLPYYSNNPFNEDLGQVMWYNSDFPFYIMRKYYPEYDYYWSLENDVFCNGNSYKPFFDKYSDDESDLIVYDFRRIGEENWPWKNNTNWCYKPEEIHGGFFPVVRISAKAADFLHQKRLQHAEEFEKIRKTEGNYPESWIYCETFVATELANNNFKCENLDEPHLRYLPIYNLNIERIFENPDFRLYHPVK